MENASKALIIAGAILLSILIIAVGMFIFTSSQNSINEGAAQISSQEKTAFNQQFNAYEGDQPGSNIKALLQNMISNAKVNEDENDKLPDVKYDPDHSGLIEIVSSIDDTNVAGFTQARKEIQTRHHYWVEIDYDANTSMVNLITIKYDKNDT